jgi:hypothetical protein
MYNGATPKLSRRKNGKTQHYECRARWVYIINQGLQPLIDSDHRTK